VGGYDNVKDELNQCVDILQNYETYSQFNIRIPKGLILEGPPGNGKTLLAKAFAGEANTSFIAVSGSEFQEKYVGVGSMRVRELFELANKNKPCIIFIDEIDALGRKRSDGSESSTSERDNTLNQLLVQMDGFDNSQGIFVIGATNRMDLLDPALTRPGRIDKNIYIGLPDAKTRKAIINIHIQGKPHTANVIIDDLVDITTGMSAAQTENLLNEAMLYALREKRFVFTANDIEHVLNRAMAGWQPNEHQFTEDMIERITIHEMGHAMIGLMVKQHTKLSKIVINLSSPKTPGYTVFEGSTSAMYTRDSLFEHLMVLLGGRIAEEIFYNVSVTTGAINDFEEALKLAEKMIVYYGMGDSPIYPSNSEKFKTQIDDQVLTLIDEAYKVSNHILRNCKDMMSECAILLKKKKVLKRDELFDMIWNKYPELMELYQY
jgi:cell division protease FtsH